MGTVGEARLTIDDKVRELPIERATLGNDGLVVATLLRDTGLVTVDPGFMNTASCRSAGEGRSGPASAVAARVGRAVPDPRPLPGSPAPLPLGALRARRGHLRRDRAGDPARRREARACATT